MLTTLAADFESWTDVLILPGIAAFFGVFIVAIAFSKEFAGEKANWKWLGIAILAAASYAGFGPFWNMVNPSADAMLYREENSTKRMIFAHWAGFLIPFLLLAASVVLSQWLARRRAREFAD